MQQVLQTAGNETRTPRSIPALSTPRIARRKPRVAPTVQAVPAQGTRLPDRSALLQSGDEFLREEQGGELPHSGQRRIAPQASTSFQGTNLRSRRSEFRHSATTAGRDGADIAQRLRDRRNTLRCRTTKTDARSRQRGSETSRPDNFQIESTNASGVIPPPTYPT